jgi:hypothetical protein
MIFGMDGSLNAKKLSTELFQNTFHDFNRLFDYNGISFVQNGVRVQGCIHLYMALLNSIRQHRSTEIDILRCLCNLWDTQSEEMRRINELFVEFDDVAEMCMCNRYYRLFRYLFWGSDIRDFHYLWSVNYTQEEIVDLMAELTATFYYDDGSKIFVVRR